MMVTSGFRTQKRIQRPGEPMNVFETVIQRNGSGSNHVGLAPVAGDSFPLQILKNPARLLAITLQSNGELATAAMRFRGSDDFDLGVELMQKRLEVPGEPLRFPAQRSEPAGFGEYVKGGANGGQREDWW